MCLHVLGSISDRETYQGPDLEEGLSRCHDAATDFSRSHLCLVHRDSGTGHGRANAQDEATDNQHGLIHSTRLQTDAHDDDSCARNQGPSSPEISRHKWRDKKVRDNDSHIDHRTCQAQQAPAEVEIVRIVLARGHKSDQPRIKPLVAFVSGLDTISGFLFMQTIYMFPQEQNKVMR